MLPGAQVGDKSYKKYLCDRNNKKFIKNMRYATLGSPSACHFSFCEVIFVYHHVFTFKMCIELNYFGTRCLILTLKVLILSLNHNTCRCTSGKMLECQPIHRGTPDLILNYTCIDTTLQFQIHPCTECISMIRISVPSVIARHNGGRLGINK